VPLSCKHQCEEKLETHLFSKLEKNSYGSTTFCTALGMFATEFVMREREREREISYEEIDYVQNLGEIMTTIFLSVSFGFCWNRDETATFKELLWVFPLQ
jgi:hypothetical protein